MTSHACDFKPPNAGGRLDAQDVKKSAPRVLITRFVIWKLILFSIACISPGPGYDTSTQLLFQHYSNADRNAHVRPSKWLESPIRHVVDRLTRWDAVYFVSSSTRGHTLEQEWAFSWLFSKVVAVTSHVLLSPIDIPAILKHAVVAILFSHIAHLLSVLTLFWIAHEILAANGDHVFHRRRALATATLHIFSPAGLFLSAPYAESTFALFNFLGFLCYIRANTTNRVKSHVLYTLSAGALFGVACTMRGNGILSGIPFAWDAIVALPRLHGPDAIRRQAATIVAGSFIAVGFALPQAVAYIDFCTSGSHRSWCTKIPPSIYSFVQSHYWDVGLFRYWTLSNLPLFVIAAPICWVMITTGAAGVFEPKVFLRLLREDAAVAGRVHASRSTDSFAQHLIPRVALPQLILAAMAITSFHVQIVNRISSGYPLWYLALSSGLKPMDTSKAPVRPWRALGRFEGVMSIIQPEWLVRGMVVYALVQGGLYASFLPPA